jgi:purine-binding chemotaxis protein CheW
MNTAQITREIQETEQVTGSLLVFRLAEQAFALAIEKVIQIIPMLRLTPVPQIDHTIEGIANIHGTLVPVISVRRHLGLPELRPGLYTPIILTQAGERPVGMIVDEVIDVISIPVNAIIAPGAILPEGMENSPVVSGLVYHHDRSILVLEPRYILRPAQFRQISQAFPNGAHPSPVSSTPQPVAPAEVIAPAILIQEAIPAQEHSQSPAANANPPLAASIEEAHPEDSAPPAADRPSRKRASRSRNVIPNTAASTRAHEQKGRDIRSVLTDQFAALAAEMQDADQPPDRSTSSETVTPGD